MQRPRLLFHHQEEIGQCRHISEVTSTGHWALLVLRPSPRQPFSTQTPFAIDCTQSCTNTALLFWGHNIWYRIPTHQTVSLEMCPIISVEDYDLCPSPLNFSSLEKAYKRYICCCRPWEVRIPFCAFLCSTVSGNWLIFWTSWEDGYVVDSRVTASVWSKEEERSAHEARKCCLHELPTFCRACASGLLPITVSTGSAHNTFSHLYPLVCLSLLYIYFCPGEVARISLGHKWVQLSFLT